MRWRCGRRRAPASRSIADLAARAPRPARSPPTSNSSTGRNGAAVRDAYGLRFAETRAYSPTFMYRALASGRADVISAFSSDGRIAADRLTVLADPAPRAARLRCAAAAPARARAHDARFLRRARARWSARSRSAAMREANYMVDRDTDKATPDAAARWLAQRIGR